MTKKIKLICISPNNNNKYYNMTEKGDGTFLAEFGRVGSSCQTKIYPMSKWRSIYEEKVSPNKKPTPYKDITDLFTVAAANETVDIADISDKVINQLIAKLQDYARKQIKTNYNVTSDEVTDRQISSAQELLNALAGLVGKKQTVDTINKILLDIYAVIPRRMRDVNDHLIKAFNERIISDIIIKEQELLDNMAGQVKQTHLVKENKSSNTNILQAMGLEIVHIDKTEIETIKKFMGTESNRFKNAYKVVNKKTQDLFDSTVAKHECKRTKLFWHGSRNENWLSILQTGLMLRPTAIQSGHMFGYGIYFADKFKKSLGYTSAKGSYWANGNSNEAFLALFDVHIGNSMKVEKHEQWMSSITHDSLRKKGNYDSVFAKGGIDLFNNEYIVYRENACTIKYIVEIS